MFGFYFFAKVSNIKIRLPSSILLRFITFASTEIDLLSEMIVDGFATQGHSSQDKWVTGYLVHYSVDGLSWDVISVKHSGEKQSEKVFYNYLGRLRFIF